MDGKFKQKANACTGAAIQSVAMYCYDCLLKFQESAWAVANHRCGQTAMGTFKNINSQTSRLTGWRTLYKFFLEPIAIKAQSSSQVISYLSLIAG